MKKSNFNQTIEFKTACAIGSAVSSLLFPHAEVVLHDLATGEISEIWNRFSGRTVGSSSLLDLDAQTYRSDIPVIGPYAKRETDGRLLKSITSVIPSSNSEQPAALLCINLDVSALEQSMGMIQNFLNFGEEQPTELFSNDWREQINFALHEWLKAKKLSKSAMTKDDKIVLARFLDSKNLFATRNSAEHFSSLIGVSRATAYNYISAARKLSDDG